MNILVTGGAGFIGRHLTKALVERGHAVCILDDFSAASPDSLDVQIYRGSVVDAELLSALLSKRGISHVFHLATRNITVSETDPVRSFAVNAGGTALLLKQAALCDVQHVVYTSTCSVYGSMMPAIEDQHPAPRSTYSIAKLAGERCCEVSPVLSTVLRLSNVYGPGQTDIGNPYCGVIGHFMRAALENKRAIVYGNGSATRDYTYVDDVVRAMLAVLDRPTAGTFNVSTGIETSTSSLLLATTLATGRMLAGTYEPLRSIDIPRRVVDSQKFRSTFGWEPSVSLATGLAKTWDWWRR